jgi:hypothetical protein
MCSRKSDTGPSGSGAEGYNHRLTLRLTRDMNKTYIALMNELRSGLSAEHCEGWEKRLRQLDEQSFQQILERIAPIIPRCNRSEVRTCMPLFEILNEAKGYDHLLALGYATVSFIPRPESSHTPATPDVYGTAAFGEALCEVKTVNLSDEDIAGFGKPQDAFYGLPEGLKHKIEADYNRACNQLHSPLVQLRGESVRRICYFCFNLDLSFQLARSNEKVLSEYLKYIEKDCEIVHATKWPEDG